MKEFGLKQTSMTQRLYQISFNDNVWREIFRYYDKDFKMIIDFSKLDLAREEDFMREAIKDTKLNCLSKVKESLTHVRKSRMRVVEHFLCDNCDKLIEKPSDGFLVQGNIFTADPKNKGGLIGNNFPEPDEAGKIESNAVKQSVLCKECFCKILGLPIQKETDRWNIKSQITSNYYR